MLPPVLVRLRQLLEAWAPRADVAPVFHQAAVAYPWLFPECFHPGCNQGDCEERDAAYLERLLALEALLHEVKEATRAQGHGGSMLETWRLLPGHACDLCGAPAVFRRYYPWWWRAPRPVNICKGCKDAQDACRAAC